jgi:hypothetical protein
MSNSIGAKTMVAMPLAGMTTGRSKQMPVSG